MTSAIALYAIIMVDTIYSGAHQLRGVSTWSFRFGIVLCAWSVRTKITPRGHRWDVPHFGAPSMGHGRLALDGDALRCSLSLSLPLRTYSAETWLRHET